MILAIKKILLTAVGAATVMVAIFLVLVSAPKYDAILSICIVSSLVSAVAWLVLARHLVWPKRANPVLAVGIAALVTIEAAFTAVFPYARPRTLLTSDKKDEGNRPPDHPRL
jgi:uncharacterized membrane protein